jgi:hypothetical protein
MRCALIGAVVFRDFSEVQAMGLVIVTLEFSDFEPVCPRRVSYYDRGLMGGI